MVMRRLNGTRQVIPQAQPAHQPPTPEPPCADPTTVPLMWTDHPQRAFRATRRGEQAIEAFREADKIDQLPWQVRGDEVVLPREAAKFRAVGEALLQADGSRRDRPR